LFESSLLILATHFRRSRGRRLIGRDVMSKPPRHGRSYGALMAFPMDATCAKRFRRRACIRCRARDAAVTNARNIPPHWFPENDSHSILLMRLLRGDYTGKRLAIAFPRHLACREIIPGNFAFPRLLRDNSADRTISRPRFNAALSPSRPRFAR